MVMAWRIGVSLHNDWQQYCKNSYIKPVIVLHLGYSAENKDEHELVALTRTVKTKNSYVKVQIQ